MEPIKHFAYGTFMGTLSLIVFLIFIINNIFIYNLSTLLIIIIVMAFFCATILIDIDHVFYYMIKTGSINVKKIWTLCFYDENLGDKNNPIPILIFHNVETLGVLLILIVVFSQFQLILMVIFLAVLFHLLLDWIVVRELLYNPIGKISLLGTMFLNRDNRQKGLN